MTWQGVIAANSPAPLPAAKTTKAPIPLRAQRAKNGSAERFDRQTDHLPSDDVMSLSPDTARNLLVQAEQALSAEHYDFAIQIGRKCVNEDQHDVDSHMVLARALMMKYRDQVDKDPVMLKECLEQFVYVARHGDHDGFQSSLAQQKMYDLTGVKWHPWLPRNTYLKKALQGDGLVAGNVVDKAQCDAKQLSSK